MVPTDWRGAATRVDLVPPIAAFVRDHPVGLTLAFGVVCRVAQWLADRPAWLDESRLQWNIQAKTIGQLFGPLEGAQLAPAGFLVVERLVAEVLGPSTFWLRLLPLLGGVATLLLAAELGRRCLRPGAVLVASALVATSGDLIYFASELKPYSTDLAVALACWLMGLDLVRRPASAWRFFLAAAGGALAPWFSFPSVFVLGGVGLVAMVSALAAREFRRVLLLLLVGGVWVASFSGCRAVARRQLVDAVSMDVFWGFAFWPWPPRSFADLVVWPVRRVLYLFLNPLEFPSPWGPYPVAVLALLLFVVGCASMARRDVRALGMLLLPGLLALGATAGRLYPFHGRLILFLVPSLLLLVAEGCAWVRDRLGRWAYRGVVLALLAGPTLLAIYHLAEPRQRMGLNPHGDNRPVSLEPGRFPF